MDYLLKQKNIIDMFIRIKKNNKLSHAYIFETSNYEEGIYIAKYFSSLLLCKNDIPCMECNTCKRIFDNVHPNITIIEPINNVIRKEQIVNLIEDFTSSSIEDGPMIYIINHSECLNPSSSNTLLKFLEEPLPNRYAIIVTNNHSLLLDTIISRAQIIHFENTEPIDIYNNYIEKGYSEELAYILSNIKDNIEYEKAKVENIYNITIKLFNTIHKKERIYTSYFTESVNMDKEDYNMLINMLIVLSIEYIKYINSGNSKLNNIYKNIKNNKITKEIALIDIYNRYFERLNYYTNINLQVSSMFIDIEKEAYND